MKKSILLTLTAVSASLFTACLFENNPDSRAMATARFEMKASTVASPLAKASASSGLIIGDSSGLQIELSEARVLVSRIKLESEDDDRDCDSSAAVLKKDGDSSETEIEDEHDGDCGDESEFSVRGPFVIDLLTGTSTPDLGSITVPAGTYRKLKIELHHGGENDSNGLHDSTLTAKGTLTLPDGAVVPFSLAVRLNENISIRNAAGITLDGSTVNTILVGLAAGDWFKGLDLTSCLGSLDSASLAGGIAVTEDSPIGKCLDAEHFLKDNIRKSFHAEERHDDDDDDEIEDDENEDDHSGQVK